jgi:hypothetical protein
MSYIGGAKAITDHAPLSLPRAVHEAAIFWSNALTVEQLPSAIDELRMSYARSRGLGFYNLTQHAIAAALVMAGAGRLAEARADFQRYFDAAVELQKLKPPDQLKLSAIFEDAVAHPPQ